MALPVCIYLSCSLFTNVSKQKYIKMNPRSSSLSTRGRSSGCPASWRGPRSHPLDLAPMESPHPRRPLHRRLRRLGAVVLLLATVGWALFVEEKGPSTSASCMLSNREVDCLLNSGCEWRDDFGGRCRLDVSFRKKRITAQEPPSGPPFSRRRRRRNGGLGRPVDGQQNGLSDS